MPLVRNILRRPKENTTEARRHGGTEGNLNDLCLQPIQSDPAQAGQE